MPSFAACFACRPYRADPAEQQHFLETARMFSSDQLVFVDETCIATNALERKWGWAVRGQRTTAPTQCVKGRSHTAMAMLCMDGIVAVAVREGFFNGDSVLEAVDNMILPKTNPYPGPRSVIVWDNVAMHKNRCVCTGFAESNAALADRSADCCWLLLKVTVAT